MAPPCSKPCWHCREYLKFDPSSKRQILDFRGLNFDPVRLLGHYQYRRAQQGLAPHSHGEMIEICYLESGRQIYAVNGREFPVVGGNVFVTFPGEHHGTSHHPETRGVLYWMLISVPAARRSFLNLPRSEGRQLLQRLLKIPRRCFHGRKTLQPLLRAIFKTYTNSHHPLRTLELRNLILRFLLDTVASAYESHPATFSPHIASSIAYIDAHLEQPLLLGELADRVKLSPTRLSAKFKEEVGIPPTDYIVRCRIERAGQLLLETDRPVTDIAFELGFSSSQYFATVFKRYTRRSPRQVRAGRPL